MWDCFRERTAGCRVWRDGKLGLGSNRGWLGISTGTALYGFCNGHEFSQKQGFYGGKFEMIWIGF